MPGIYEQRWRWAVDFIDPDPSRRRAAKVRNDRYRAEHSESIRRENALWWSNGQSYDFSAEPALEAEFYRQVAIGRTAGDHTIYGALSRFIDASWYPDRWATFEQLTPYAVLFLRWEATYPEEWGAGDGAPWGLKKRILRSFARAGVPDSARAQLVELVTQAVSRTYRCEDRWYAALARRVDGPDLRAALDERRKSPDDLVRVKADYVEAVLADAEMPVTRASWRRYLACSGTNVTEGPWSPDPGGQRPSAS
ncbi:hypothetical protein GCM10009554_38040 [Kribbella koreensis]|uniref:Uncharacterized protein n=1 Tax=Kribbella koreensis TaxID=57909 RepID=A0ABN1QLI7_9ACTN